jgi:hypothetical protein
MQAQWKAMPATFHATKAEIWAANRPVPVIPAKAGIHLLSTDVDPAFPRAQGRLYAGVTATAVHGMSDAPEFVLLDAAGPRPEALLLSSGLLSALLVLAGVLSRPVSATPLSRVEMVSEVVLPHGPLWLPASPARLSSRQKAAVLFERDSSARQSPPLLVPSPPVEAITRTAPPAPVSPKLQMSLLPFASSDVLTSALKLPPPPAGTTPVAAGDARKPVPMALGTLPLPRLIEQEAALAGGLAALSPGRRLALPRLSIRVDADWLEALPQTKEELYFSVTRPQEDSEVLAYWPASHSFSLKHPRRPLWQIREAEQVPALAALRSAAARQLGVSPELVGLYTWHPPVLEDALRMFVLARMEHLGVQLGPSDMVTVRFASGPEGCLMSLEPIRAAGSP